MTLNLHLPNQMEELKPSITVVGVGGAGGNAVNNMIAAQLEGVNFVVANTDVQALNNSLATSGIQLGKGLGAGGNPKVAHDAAEEAAEQLSAYMEGSHMVFITAGMGGGTGTGAAPVVAKLAKELGILTVAVVTKPFQFEGTHRMRVAEAGLKELQEYVDTLIIIPNQNLFRIANERTTFADAFKMADEVLHSGVRGVTDLIVKPGLINLDFADIRSVMREMGKAMMGTGEATGERRAIEAAEAAISNPLLDDVSLKGAKALLINITGGPDMTLFEVDEAANRVRSEVDPDANIIFGSTFNDVMEGKIRVSVVATGIDSQSGQGSRVTTQTTEPKKNMMFNMPRPEPIKAPARPTFETARSSFLTDAALGKPTTPKFEPEVTAAAAAPRPALVVHEEPAPQMHAQPQHQPASVKTPMTEYKIEEFVMADEAPAISPRRDAQAAQQVAAEEGAPRFGLFARLADAGKAALARNEAQAAAKAEAPAQPERSLHVTEKPRPEAKQRAAAMADEDQYLDIPAFLRRQAN